jgi:hypothetical protein
MNKDRLYIVRKYIMAKSAKEAIERDKKSEVDDVWVDEDWKSNEVGFKKE